MDVSDIHGPAIIVADIWEAGLSKRIINVEMSESALKYEYVIIYIHIK